MRGRGTLPAVLDTPVSYLYGTVAAAAMSPG